MDDDLEYWRKYAALVLNESTAIQNQVSFKTKDTL